MNGSFLFLFALTAAVGNACFAAGQRKAETGINSLLFIGLSAAVCLILTTLFLLIFNRDSLSIGSTIQSNWPQILLSGAGLFLTYLGFNLLYRNFGTGGYVYYAVLSIITTSVIVGIVIFGEKMNGYHITSIVLSIAAIVLFTAGNNAAG